jgi:hypothetical protein
MKALVSPNEIIFSYEHQPIGKRVAQVCEQKFDVAPPLFWLPCPEECQADRWYYNEEGVLLPIPLPPKLETINTDDAPAE